MIGDDGDHRAPEPVQTGERLVPGAHPDHVTEAEHLARYQLAASLAEGRRVLDAACGLGYGSAMMARAGAQAVTGVDVDLPTIEWATERFGGDAQFVAGDVMTLPFEHPVFDLVVSFETIEHVADPFGALDELKRVMVEGGLLVASSPNKGAYREDNPFHLQELTSDEFRVALESRFANVRILRQHMHMASAIYDDETMSRAGVEHEIGGSVQKLVADEPGSELFTIGIASDGELPEVPLATTLTGGVAMRHWFDAAAAWEERARRAEANAEASWIEIAHARNAERRAREELQELKLRGAKRSY